MTRKLPKLTPDEAQDVLAILRRPYVYKQGALDYRVKVRDARGNWRNHGGVFTTRAKAYAHLAKLTSNTSTEAPARTSLVKTGEVPSGRASEQDSTLTNNDPGKALASDVRGSADCGNPDCYQCGQSYAKHSTLEQDPNGRGELCPRTSGGFERDLYYTDPYIWGHKQEPR